MIRVTLGPGSLSGGLNHPQLIEEIKERLAEIEEEEWVKVEIEVLGEGEEEL